MYSGILFNHNGKFDKARNRALEKCRTPIMKRLEIKLANGFTNPFI